MYENASSDFGAYYERKLQNCRKEVFSWLQLDSSENSTFIHIRDTNLNTKT